MRGRASPAHLMSLAGFSALLAFGLSAQWTDWLPVTFGESPLDLSDPDAASVPARFYRLAIP